MTLHRAPLLVECFYLWCGTTATFVIRSVEDHQGSSPQRVCSLCAIISVCASIVGGPRTNHALRRHGVLASLDATTQFTELVWKNSSAFLKHPYLLFIGGRCRAHFKQSRQSCVLLSGCLSELVTHPAARLPIIGVFMIVHWYGKLPPVTSLLLDFNGFCLFCCVETRL